VRTDVFDAARQHGDRPADELLGELGEEARAVGAALRGVRRNDQVLPASLSAQARRFLGGVTPPPWVDRTRVLRAQRWADAHLVPVTTALLCASLPSAYAAERGARVLAATGRLQSDIDRRVNETARFVLDLLEPGALDPQGTGVLAVQRTRLVHAAVRRSLAKAGQPGDDVPINKEDLLGTLLTFSVVVIRAVRRLGIAVDARTADDYLHLWRAIGCMLGIEEQLLPTDFVDATRTSDFLARRHFRSSAHGRALMAALLARMEDHLPGLRQAPRLVVRHLVGDPLADLLGVPAGASLPVLGARARARTFDGWLARVSSLLARPVLEAIVAHKLSSSPRFFTHLPAPGHG